MRISLGGASDSSAILLGCCPERDGPPPTLPVDYRTGSACPSVFFGFHRGRESFAYSCVVYILIVLASRTDIIPPVPVVVPTLPRTVPGTGTRHSLVKFKVRACTPTGRVASCTLKVYTGMYICIYKYIYYDHEFEMECL
jgi:hypothetical protein